MIIRPSHAFAIVWIGWIASWMAASFWSARTEKRAATWETWTYRIAVLAGAVLLWLGAGRMLAQTRLWHVGYGGAYALVGVTLAGILFTWWARLHLGRLWSSAITRKQDHRVVDTGPYALVRHPIYTGLIAAILATAAAEATVTALLGGVLIVFGLWLKARAEERFLMAELGTDAYGAYRRRVPMLVPFLPHR
jgi:protein-S-isoprenylcysteine O-methyltransferase Ste14